MASYDHASKNYDYIIVGAGSAGCVLASRLSEHSGNSVLLIEAGRDTPPGAEPDDVTDLYPMSFYNPANMWPRLRAHWRRRDNSPSVSFLQARITGGGSSVMGMVALRGVPDDYQEWEARGASGWSWSDVLPYFRRLETDLDFVGDLHGTFGPVPIRRVKHDDWPPLTQAIHAFASERQIPTVADMNGDFRDGYCSVPMSNWPDKRASAAMCYLTADVRKRQNLTILTQSTVSRLLLEGRRSTGVAVRIGDDDHRFYGRTTIISMGAIHSPVFLMRAGIGSALSLRKVGIDVVADLPGVGENLQNHAMLLLATRLRPGFRQVATLRTHPTTCFRYSSNLDGCPRSDIYINVHNKTSWNAMGPQLANIAPVLWRPMGRGKVSLTRETTDRLAPLVEFNFLDDERDLQRMISAFYRVLEIFSFAAVQSLCTKPFLVCPDDRIQKLNALSWWNGVKARLVAKGFDLVPSIADFAISKLLSSDATLDEMIADPQTLQDSILRNVTGMFHAAGTCRMGRIDDQRAVVDSVGRVRFMEGLRVIDASIMPTVPSGNTNIPTIMLAEKLAAEIDLRAH